MSKASRALFKERRFAPGETITKEGAGGAAFFVIESGDATVSIGGRQRRDARPVATTSARSPSSTKAHARRPSPRRTDLVCYGLTYWEFRPLVQQNATIAWNLLQTLAKRLRTAQDDQPA